MASKVTLAGQLMFPSDFLAAVEFTNKAGQPCDATLTIAAVKIENLKLRGGATSTKPVLTFVETKKKLVCNKTNAESIAVMYGNEAKAWVGKRVTFFPTRVPFGRETVDAIRVREQVPPGAQQPPANIAPKQAAPPLPPVQQPEPVIEEPAAQEEDEIPFEPSPFSAPDGEEDFDKSAFMEDCRRRFAAAKNDAAVAEIFAAIDSHEQWLGAYEAGNLRNELRLRLPTS